MRSVVGAVLLFAASIEATAQGEDARYVDAPAYELAAVYTGDVWRNARGGLRTGSTYLDNLDLTLAVDGERAWGARGLRAFVDVLYNNAARFSERYVGDAMTVSNIDAGRAVRLYEAWLDWSADTAQWFSVRAGLYDLNSEFDTTESRSLFIHSAHGVGHELAQTGANGPSIFPVTSFALRVAWAPTEQWRVLAAVLDGVPGDRDNPSRSGIHLSSDEGALTIAEMQFSSKHIAELSLGYWRYTADAQDVRPGHFGRGSNSGAYAAVELPLDGVLDGSPRTFAFLRYGMADERVNDFDEFFGIGLRKIGPFPGRPNDEVGLAFARTGVSAAARMPASSDGTRREPYEAAFELTYRAPLTDWLVIQPDVQFIIKPGADPALGDSVVLGLRFEVSLLGMR